MKFVFYLLVIFAIVVLIRQILAGNQPPGESRKGLPRFRFRPKLDSRQAWVQVYDTDSLDEIKLLQARFEEEEIECFIYEQGRKDMHGNQLKGYGIAVSRSSVSQAQKIIARMPA